LTLHSGPSFLARWLSVLASVFRALGSPSPAGYHLRDPRLPLADGCARAAAIFFVSSTRNRLLTTMCRSLAVYIKIASTGTFQLADHRAGRWFGEITGATRRADASWCLSGGMLLVGGGSCFIGPLRKPGRWDITMSGSPCEIILVPLFDEVPVDCIF